VGVADITLHATVGAELQQVDHHDTLVGRPCDERRGLFWRRLEGRAHR
jgi:hypothetical protein